MSTEVQIQQHSNLNHHSHSSHKSHAHSSGSSSSLNRNSQSDESNLVTGPNSIKRSSIVSNSNSNSSSSNSSNTNSHSSSNNDKHHKHPHQNNHHNHHNHTEKMSSSENLNKATPNNTSTSNDKSTLNNNITSETHFDCKSCHLPINEGQAYELAGDRWHVECFKCSKCFKSLGVDSNFLVLGTGALVCSDCSYCCKSCNKKIYDMAILTGDHAYCANCFRCRSCKKPIDDLRYARTSKGLFCMPCHHKLMERKKKYESMKKFKEHPQLPKEALHSTSNSSLNELKRPPSSADNQILNNKNLHSVNSSHQRQTSPPSSRSSSSTFQSSLSKTSLGSLDKRSLSANSTASSSSSASSKRTLDPSPMASALSATKSLDPKLRQLQQQEQQQLQQHTQIQQQQEVQPHSSAESASYASPLSSTTSQPLLQPSSSSSSFLSSSTVQNGVAIKSTAVPISKNNNMNNSENSIEIPIRSPKRVGVESFQNMNSTRVEGHKQNNSISSVHTLITREAKGITDEDNEYDEQKTPKVDHSAAYRDELDYNEATRERSSTPALVSANTTPRVKAGHQSPLNLVLSPNCRKFTFNEEGESFMDLESHGSSTDDGGQYDDADDDMYEAVNGNGEQFRGLNLQFPMGNGKDKVPSSSSAANTKSGNDLSSLDKTPKLSNSDETVDDEKFLELPKSPGPRPPPLPVPNVPNSSISQQSDVPTSATRSGSPRLGEEIKGLNIGGLKLDGRSFSAQNYNAKLSYSTNENVSNSSTSDQSDTDDVKRSQQFKFGGASHSSNTDSQKQQSSRNPKSPTFQNSSSSPNPNLQINNNAPNSSLTNNQFSPLLSEQGQEKFDSISNTANGNNNNNNSGGVSRSFSISKRLFTRHKKSSSSQDKISVGNNHANNDSDIFNDKRKSTENKRKNFENSIASSILPSKSKSPTPKFSHNRSVSETETINEYPRIGEISSNLENQLSALKNEIAALTLTKNNLLRDVQNLNNQKRILEIDINFKQNKIKELDHSTNKKFIISAPLNVNHSQANNGNNNNNNNNSNNNPQFHPQTTSSATTPWNSHFSNVATPSQGTTTSSGPSSKRSSTNAKSNRLSIDQITQFTQVSGTNDNAAVKEKDDHDSHNESLKNKKGPSFMKRLFGSSNDNANSAVNGNYVTGPLNNFNTVPNANINGVNGGINNNDIGNNNTVSNGVSANHPNLMVVGSSSNSIANTTNNDSSLPTISNPMNFRTGGTNHVEKSNRRLSLDPNQNGSNEIVKSRSTNFLSSFRNNNNAEQNSDNPNNNTNGIVSSRTSLNNLVIYSTTLQQRADIEKRSIPFIISKCLHEIEDRGLDTEGIYRVSGSSSVVDRIEKAFELYCSNKDRDMKLLNAALDNDINAVAGMLKRYLKSLPDAVIPFRCYEAFVSSYEINDYSERVAKLRSSLSDIPEANRLILRLLAEHLNTIASHEGKNKMNVGTLATVFAPTLVRDDGITAEREILDVQAKKHVTEFLLTYHKDIL